MEQIVTSNGITVQAVGVSPKLLGAIQQAYLDKNPPPVRPHYAAEAIGGDVEMLPHDETTLRTDEEKEAWARYKADDTQWKAGLNERMMHAIALKGLAVPAHYQESNWAEIQEFLGIVVPVEPAKRLLHYYETEIMSSKDDTINVMVAVLRASGLDEAEAARIEATFRADVQGAAGDDGQPATEQLEV